MDKGWSIDISELSGHLLYNLYSDNVELNHENGSSILFPKANADIEIIPLLSGKIVLDKLLVSKTEIRLIAENKLNDSIIENIKFEPEKIPINIKNVKQAYAQSKHFSNQSGLKYFVKLVFHQVKMNL